jgi:hypothetical protein
MNEPQPILAPIENAQMPSGVNRERNPVESFSVRNSEETSVLLCFMLVAFLPASGI